MKLNQITDTINKINELAKDIELLDKQVRLCAEGQSKVELAFIFTDVKAKAKIDAEAILGEEKQSGNSFQTSYGLISFSGGQLGIQANDRSYESEYVANLSDSESIEIIGMLINKKKVAKEKLLKKLDKAGIKIN